MFPFDARSFDEPKLSMETFREWANSIAHQYLSGNGSPTAGVIKIAQTEELTPSQIELLATETNKLIHTAKYASSKDDKYFAAEFPHADAKAIIEYLQATDQTKIAASMPDPTFRDDRPDEFAMFGITPPVMDKTASVKRELQVAQEKVALLKEKSDDRTTLAKYAAENSERAFIKEARQLTLSGDNSLGRMSILGTMDQMLKVAGMAFAKKSLAKLAYVLGKEGLLWPEHTEKAMGYFLSKEADQNAPQEIISGWMQARVVNGQHPLYITLKTFRDTEQSLRECSDRSNIIQDKLHITKQRIRAL